MRIAVTGASGFIGGCLAHALASDGYTVFAFGRRHAGALRRPLPRYQQWDLAAGPVTVSDVDVVVHCAAQVGDWGCEADYRRVNVDGTRAVLETFHRADRFIHVSSASVYSLDQPTRHLTESASIGQGLYNAYGRTKAEAESVVLASGRSAVILRPQIVYGPGDTTLLPRVLAARVMGWLAVPGDGRNRISVTHIFNFVDAVRRVLESGVAEGVFNISDREDAQVDELLRTLLRLNGAETRLLFVARPIAWTIAAASERLWRSAGAPRAPRLTRYLVSMLADQRTLDLTRAYTLLGYAPRFSFRDGPTHAAER